MKTALMGAILALIALPSTAGDFSDSGQELDNKLLEQDAEIQALKGNVLELDQRLKAFESGEVIQPTREPVVSIEPGREPLQEAQSYIPGRIQFEDFDWCPNGGEGLCYHDTSPENVGQAYRQTEAVDIKATADESGLWQVGWTNNNIPVNEPGDEDEWLKFTVGIIAGIYDIHVRGTSKSDAPGLVHLYMDDVPLGSVDIPNTGDWSGANSATEIIRGVTLQGGNHTLKAVFEGGPADYNWIEFVPADEAVNRAPYDILICDPLPNGDADIETCV